MLKQCEPAYASCHYRRDARRRLQEDLQLLADYCMLHVDCRGDPENVTAEVVEDF